MPRPDGSVRLPSDMPPSKRTTRIPLTQGIVTHGAAGEVAVPLYSVPWNPMDSKTFPAVEGSNAAATIGSSGIFPVRRGDPNMNALRPRWVVALNRFSPIAHRSTPAIRDDVPPRAISARGVGAVTQRPRGYAAGYTTFWPSIAPQWPTWRERPGTRQG